MSVEMFRGKEIIEAEWYLGAGDVGWTDDERPIELYKVWVIGNREDYYDEDGNEI